VSRDWGRAVILGQPVQGWSLGAQFQEAGIFEPYIWRHPARMTPQRLAELAEWDRRNRDEDKMWRAAARQQATG
jgi:hypothetical protein